MGIDHAAFSATMQQAIGETLAEAVDAEGLRTLLDTAAQITERTLAEENDGEQAALVACHAGCAACCSLNVAVLLPEAITIAAWLREPAFTQLAETVGTFARYLRWVDDEERIRLRIPCAFLDHRGWCLIHPLRPLMCRSIAATDPDQCRKSLEITWMDDEEPVTLNLEQKFFYDEAFIHVATALDRRGLDSRSMELHTAVQAFRDRPERVAEFLAGERISL